MTQMFEKGRRLHPLTPARRERLRQRRIRSVDIFEESNISILFDHSSSVDDKHRNRRIEIDPKGMPAVHRLLNAFARPLGLVPQHPGRKFFRLLDTDTAVTKIAPGF